MVPCPTLGGLARAEALFQQKIFNFHLKMAAQRLIKTFYNSYLFANLGKWLKILFVSFLMCCGGHGRRAALNECESDKNELQCRQESEDASLYIYHHMNGVPARSSTIDNHPP